MNGRAHLTWTELICPHQTRVGGRVQLAVFLSPQYAVDIAREAERLGLSHAIVPEGFRGDAISVLGAVAASTSRIKLATGLLQLPARTPVLTALTAAPLDELSGHRFHLGLGVSNPDVSRGWYGVDFDDPLGRIREYIDVVRLALAGEPVKYDGQHYRLPPDGQGAPAQFRAVRPRPDLPIFLGGIGPGSIRLAGEIGDGWIGSFCSPERIEFGIARAASGRARAGRDLTGFEVLPSVPIGLGAPAESAAAGVRLYYANFLGMGRLETNIYARLASELGYREQTAHVHELCAHGDRDAAARAVPLGFVEQTSLLGDVGSIAARMTDYARAGGTTLGLTLLDWSPERPITTLRGAAEAARNVSAEAMTP